MCDGLAFEDLTDADGLPIGDFWDRMQEQYAQLHGTRDLGDLKPRKDRGCQRKKGVKRKGKVTLTSVKRARAKAVTVVPVASGSLSVFGFEHVPCARLKELCVAEETEKFKRILQAAQQRFRKQKEDTEQVQNSGGQTRLCTLSDRKRAAVTRESTKRRARAANSCIQGWSRLSWKALRRKIGGETPWVYVADADNLPGAKLDARYGNTTLRDCATTDIVEWMQRAVHPDRRILLVPSIENIPWSVGLLAIIYGAHIREELLRPLIQFKLSHRCVMNFTAEFARAHREVARVAREATVLTYRLGLQNASGRGHSVQVQAPFLSIPLPKLLQEVWAKAKKAEVNPRWVQEYSIIYEDFTDGVLQTLPTCAKKVARTFPEFLKAIGALDKRHVWIGA